MKRILFVVLSLVCIIPSISCSGDDKVPVKESTALHGTWYLTKVSGGVYQDASHEIEPGVISWNFNEPNGTLNVIRHKVSILGTNGLQSGTYAYSYQAGGSACPKMLFIDGGEYGCITLTNETLTIRKDQTDGTIYTFTR